MTTEHRFHSSLKRIEGSSLWECKDCGKVSSVEGLVTLSDCTRVTTLGDCPNCNGQGCDDCNEYGYVTTRRADEIRKKHHGHGND